MLKEKNKKKDGGGNATTPSTSRNLQREDYSPGPASPSNHVNPGDSYQLKDRHPDDQSVIIAVQKAMQSGIRSQGISSTDDLPTKKDAASQGARAANFFRYLHKMKPQPKAAWCQMHRDILSLPKNFTAKDLEKAIEDSPFFQRLAEPPVKCSYIVLKEPV